MSSYIVVCRADRVGQRKGQYVLTTRHVFGSRDEAEKYASTVAASREAIVVEGRWRLLRFTQPGSPAMGD